MILTQYLTKKSTRSWQAMNKTKAILMWWIGLGYFGMWQASILAWVFTDISEDAKTRSVLYGIAAAYFLLNSFWEEKQ